MDKLVNWVMDQSLHYNLDSLKVSLIMFFLNIVDFPMFFLLLSTWNDFSGVLRDWYLNLILPLRPSKSCRVGWGVSWPM